MWILAERQVPFECQRHGYVAECQLHSTNETVGRSVDVLMSRCRTLMAEPKRNDADVDTGLQQVHCRRAA